MADFNPHSGRKSEEAPRLLAMEPWITGARVLWVGPAAEESIEWLHRLGASRVSLLGERPPAGLRADVYLEPDGLSEVPSQRHDLVIVQDFGARLARQQDLLVDVERLLAPDGRIVGVLPTDGEHVGLDMIAHRDEQPRLDYAEVITALETRFDYVTAIAQVPLLGYLITGTGEDRAIQFDGRLSDIAAEPPIYHIVAGFKKAPAELGHRITTLSFDQLSERVGRVVERITTESEATRRDANSSLSRLEQRVDSLVAELEQAEQKRGDADKRVKRLQRERDGLKAQLGEREHTAADHAQLVEAFEARLEDADAAFQALEAEHERLRVEAEAANSSLAAKTSEATQAAAQLSVQERALAALERQADSDRSHLEALIANGTQRAQALVDQAFEQHKALEQAEAELELIRSERADLAAARDHLLESQAALEGAGEDLRERLADATAQTASLTAERDALTDLLEAERAARASDPVAHELAAARVDYQVMAAASYRLRQSNYRQRREHAEATGQLRRVQGQYRQSENLLNEAQLRLESASRQKDEGHDATLLAHVKGQLAEAIHAQEALDEQCSALRRKLADADRDAESLRQQLSELEALRPERDQFDQERRLLKAQLDRHKKELEAASQGRSTAQQALEASQEREELLKARSVELAEAVSNLAARVDVLEQETAAQVEAIAEREATVTQLTQSLDEQKAISTSVRKELEVAQQTAGERDLSDRIQALEAEAQTLEQRYQATLEALQQQGTEAAANEQALRGLELENQRLRASQLARKHEPSDRVVELQTRVAQSEQERQRLEGELSSLRVRFERQAEQLAGLHGAQAELESLRADRTSLSQEVERLNQVERHAQGLEARSADQDTLIEALEQRLLDATERSQRLLEERDESRATEHRTQQDTADQVQAARRDLEEQLAEAQERAATAEAQRERLNTELIALRALADPADKEALANASEGEAPTKAGDAQQIEELKRALDAAQAALEAAQENWAAERDALEEHHQLTMRQALARAADVQQANTNKLEREVAALKERAGSIQAQEDRILQLVEEQRQAADQAWDLAIAQRTARFATLIDRFDQVVHAAAEKEL